MGLCPDVLPSLSILKSLLSGLGRVLLKIWSNEFMGAIQDFNSISFDGHRKSQFLTSFKKNSVQCYKEMSLLSVI